MYRQILVLAAVRLGCNFDYDRRQDLAENHRKLRHMMGIGDWDEACGVNWRRIRDNVCLLKPDTIAQISELIVRKGHELNPNAAKTARADSFVMETNIHYPTDSSLIWDGVRTIMALCVLIANDLVLSGWRQHAHLRKKIKRLHGDISRAAASKSPKAKAKLTRLYAELLQRTEEILQRAEILVQNVTTTDAVTLGRVEKIRFVTVEHDTLPAERIGA